MNVHKRYLDSLVRSGLVVVGHEPTHVCCDHIYDSYCSCCMSECEAWGDMTNQKQGEENE